jgi:hypothetical protein
MTESLAATIMVRKDGKTQKGDDSVQFRFNEVDDGNTPVWAFKWAVKKVKNYEVGDQISLTYDDVGEDKPFLIIKDVAKGKPGGKGTRKASSGSSSTRTGGDNSRDIMMAFSYLKDLHEQYLKASAKDPVKSAIKAGASLYEGAKNIVNPPQTPPENAKKANDVQEGRIRTMVDTIGCDSNSELWKNFVKTRYGLPLSHENAIHMIDMLQKTIDGKMEVTFDPSGEIMFHDPKEQKPEPVTS